MVTIPPNKSGSYFEVNSALSSNTIFKTVPLSKPSAQYKSGPRSIAILSWFSITSLRALTTLISIGNLISILSPFSHLLLKVTYPLLSLHTFCNSPFILMVVCILDSFI